MNTQRTPILITGALGYIGSHTVLDLVQAGYQPILVDDLSRADKSIYKRLEKIAACPLVFYPIDVRNTNQMKEIFEAHKPRGVIHFAAYKAVGESVAHPLRYYDNNLVSLISLLNCVATFQTPHFIFSSSCTVYGQPKTLPVTEETACLQPASPYGATKQMSERILNDYYRTTPHSQQSAILLRYFNPAGAHHSGLLGEVPVGAPQNLIPAITRCAQKGETLHVFGDDYDTRDGSCIRDFIHVEDLAHAHTLALQKLEKEKPAHPTEIFNLGTGEGVTVLEAIAAFLKTSGTELKYAISARRAGDVAKIYASKEKAERELGWKARYTLEDITRTAWAWEQVLASRTFEHGE